MARVEAVIVAGGFGTRLRPLTAHRPKHLLPVAGIPFVAHQLAKLAAADVRRVVLATSYHAEQFEPTLGDGRQWGIELVYVRENEPLGTGGAIRNAAAQLASRPDDPVVVLNGDVLSSHDLRSQLHRHRRRADVTLHLVEVADARPYGCVPTDDSGRVTAFLEKDPHPVSHQINAGCYVFTRRVIDDIPAGRVVSVERETFPAMLAQGRTVAGHVEDCYWIDVGSPESLRRASCDLVLGVTTSPALTASSSTHLVGNGAEIDESADIGGGSSLGPEVRVHAGAVVDGSVVMAGAQIGAGARVIRCVVGQGATIGPDVVITDVAVGDGEAVESSPG